MKPMLKVQSLKKYFPVYGGLLSRVIGQVKAVDDVSFEIKEGEILGMVGESGCGKTTIGRMTLRLLEPTAGKVFFEDTDLFNLKGKEMAMIRRKMQIIFQFSITMPTATEYCSSSQLKNEFEIFSDSELVRYTMR